MVLLRCAGATFKVVWSYLQDDVIAQYGSCAVNDIKHAIWESLGPPDVSFMERVEERLEEGVEEKEDAPPGRQKYVLSCLWKLFSDALDERIHLLRL